MIDPIKLVAVLLAMFASDEDASPKNPSPEGESAAPITCLLEERLGAIYAFAVSDSVHAGTYELILKNGGSRNRKQGDFITDGVLPVQLAYGRLTVNGELPKASLSIKWRGGEATCTL